MIKRSLFYTLLFFIIPVQSFCSELLPVKGEVATRVNFWKKVYTEINSNQAFLHDSEDLSIIYSDFNFSKSRRSRLRQAIKIKNQYRRLLRSMAKKSPAQFSKQEKKIHQIIGNRSPKELRDMSHNLRFQFGLKDRYYQGLIRSYEYLEHIRKTFKKMNIPPEIVYLPHVESSFNYNAYSKVGAAGMWQFMRSTAKRFNLKVNYLIDERRDPIKSTYAAAKLLQANYKLLKSWPLALTAYNHGAASLLRAQRKLGTSDIEKIIKNYRGRRFGFASKNFYATFMATVEISKEPEKYFPSFKLPKKHKVSHITLDKNYTLKELSTYLNFSLKKLKQLNPAIRRSAFTSELYLPPRFEINIPHLSSKELESLKNKLAKTKSTYKEGKVQRLHIVSRGENLFDIARLYGTKVYKIVQFNQILNPSRIYPGMKIKIPGKQSSLPPKIAKKTTTEVPKSSSSSEKTEQKVTINTDKDAHHYKDTAKPGSLLSKLKTFVRPQKPKVPKTDLSKLEEAPNPFIDLSSYSLDLRKKSKDIYILTIETEETLGHYAEWAQVRTQRIRNINQMRRRSRISLGDQILVPLAESQIAEFKRLRNEYHLSIQEDFYDHYTVKQTSNYTVRSGDSISSILKQFDLPYWILRKTQKDQTLNENIRVGQKIILPIIEEITSN